MPEEQSETETSDSLLQRLQLSPADQTAGAEFVRRYGSRIHDWCRRWGLQESDAQDVVQNVLLKLTRAMQAFQYDPSQRFRTWLETVTQNARQDFARGRRPTVVGDLSAEDPLPSLAARDDLELGVQAAYGQELFDRAMERPLRRSQKSALPLRAR